MSLIQIQPTKIATSMAQNSDTLARVGDQLAARQNAERLLLAVDQFEELFTQCKNPAEQQAFVENIVHAANSKGVYDGAAEYASRFLRSRQ